MKKIEFTPTNYPSDLSDKEWSIIEGFFSAGNKSAWHKRTLVNAVLYIKDNGCKWRGLPHDYPPHNTVWTFFRRARDSGLWEKIMDALVKQMREKVKRSPLPSYGIIDSQSVKTIAASEEHGIDGGKKRFLRPKPAGWLRNWKYIIRQSMRAGLIWRKLRSVFYHGNAFRVIVCAPMICVTRFARGSFAETRPVFPSIGSLLLPTPESSSKSYILFCYNF